jgi:hypothetical protein
MSANGARHLGLWAVQVKQNAEKFPQLAVQVRSATSHWQQSALTAANPLIWNDFC